MGRPMGDNMHPLLKRATRYVAPEAPHSPLSCRYDFELGVWLTESSEVFVTKPGRRDQRTKKADIETGEDQKGS